MLKQMQKLHSQNEKIKASLQPKRVTAQRALSNLSANSPDQSPKSRRSSQDGNEFDIEREE